MARNRTKVINQLFEFIEQHVLSHIDGNLSAQQRNLNRSVDDNRWLGSMKISSNLTVLPNLATLYVMLDAKKYFVVIGWEEEQIENYLEELLAPQTINAGLFTVLVTEKEEKIGLPLKIRRNADAREIFNNILSQHDGVEGYTGHNFLELVPYFEPFAIFEMISGSRIYDFDLVRTTAYLFGINPKNLILPFSNETMTIFQDICLFGSAKLPYEDILLSLISFNWRYSFLHIYRCLERLLPVCVLSDIYPNYIGNITFEDFALEIKRLTSWQPKEEAAWEHLIENVLPKQNYLSLLAIKQKIVGINDQQSLAKWFYNLRNRIVHRQKGDEVPRLGDTVWDELIRVCLDMLKVYYQHYDIYIGI
jgi:hypothetical protein